MRSISASILLLAGTSLFASGYLVYGYRGYVKDVFDLAVMGGGALLGLAGLLAWLAAFLAEGKGRGELPILVLEGRQLVDPEERGSRNREVDRERHRRGQKRRDQHVTDARALWTRASASAFCAASSGATIRTSTWPRRTAEPRSTSTVSTNPGSFARISTS